MSEGRIEKLARALFEAKQRCEAVAPLTETYGEIDAEEAYRVQRRLVELEVRSGARVVGHKVALTSLATQQMFGMSEPVYGYLTDRMVVSEGEPIPARELIEGRAEGEIAFVLARSLRGPGVTVADVLTATRGVMAAIEVPDSRIKGWKVRAAEIIADNAAAGRVVLGGRLVPVEGLDLRTLGMILRQNGRVISTGAGAAVLGHPAAAVAWLANRLGAVGEQLEVGELVISGTPAAPANVKAGDVVDALWAELGSVTAVFV